MAALVGLLAGSAYAVTGTVAVTYAKLYNPNKIAITWTTGTAGTGVVATLDEYQAGWLDRVVFKSSCATNYTVTLRDSEGVDLLADRGALISSNAVTCIAPGMMINSGSVTNGVVPFAINGPITCVVSNNLFSQTGYIYLYIKH